MAGHEVILLILKWFAILQNRRLDTTSFETSEGPPLLIPQFLFGTLSCVVPVEMGTRLLQYLITIWIVL